MNRRGFASDNNAGVHPEIMKAINNVNEGHVLAYGDDSYTAAAVKKIRAAFGEDTGVYFVFLGTGANVLSLASATRPFNSVICAETAHIEVDECGAPEKFTGCKLLTVETSDGKLTVEGIRKHLHGIGFEHHSQPAVVSITQATELGTVYSLEETRELADFVHRNGMILHMDGARIANAAVHLGASLRAATRDAGVDILSFGGTKNGMMYGEAILFFNNTLEKNFRYIRKQGMQLASKMRFIAAQFDAMMTDELWKRSASHSNAMALKLAEAVGNIPGVRITQKVQANAVFATIPPSWTEPLQKEYFFYEWNEDNSEVRWMTSFDTAEEDIEEFSVLLRKMAVG